MNYRFANSEDKTVIHRIWRSAFPADEEAAVDAFLAVIDLKTECLLAVDDTPVSMVFLLPALLKTDEKTVPLQYIYAAATLPERRGEGVFGGLLTEALRIAEIRGCVASFLRPAEPSLQHYYAKFGYEPFFYCTILTGTAAAEAVTVCKISSEIYGQERAKRVPVNSVLLEPRFLENTYRLGDEGYALCEPRGKVLHIPELFCEPSFQERLCRGLAAHFGCERYECRVPAESEARDCFGMLKSLRKFEPSKNAVPYMGTALD